MRKIVVVALLAVVLPATAAAQWSIRESEVDPFTDERPKFASLSGEENKLRLSYSCMQGFSRGLLLMFFNGANDGDMFASGSIQIRFDDDTAERASWDDGNSSLSLVYGADSFVQRMAQHQTLLLGVTVYQGEGVRDSFNLTGTAAMFEELNCEGE